jgi:DHA1 family tetracycline resistance protein-like MFS transporter
MEPEKGPLLGSDNINQAPSGFYSASLEQVDPFEPVERYSVYQRKSFLDQITGGNSNNSSRNGVPQIILMAFLLAMAFGSTLAILPSFMTERLARVRYGYDGSEDCHSFSSYETKPMECIQGSKDAQTAAAISELISNILTLLTSSFIGSVSDIHGRRPVLIAGILISSLGPISLLLTALRPNMSVMVYYCTKSFQGLMHWMVIALSSFADVLPKRQRAAGVGLLMAGFWLGLCTAPTLTVFLPQLKVIVISCVFQFMGLACAIFFVPETLPPHTALEAIRNRNDLDWKPKSNLQQVTAILGRPIRELSIVNRNSFLRLLSMLAFFSGMATSGDQTLLLYYVDSVLSFEPTDIAVMFLLVGISSVLAQAVILRPLNYWIGERLVVVVCFVAATISNTMYGLASDRKSFYMAVCIGALSGMAFPTISAIKANNVELWEQGRIQGALFSIQALSAGAGPMAMRSVDSLAKRTGMSPGSMFFFAAFLQSIALYCSCRLPNDKSNSKNAGDYDEQTTISDPRAVSSES